MRGRGGIVQWGAFREIHSNRGFNRHDIVLAAEGSVDGICVSGRLFGLRRKAAVLVGIGSGVGPAAALARGGAVLCDVGIRLGWQGAKIQTATSQFAH